MKILRSVICVIITASLLLSSFAFSVGAAEELSISVGERVKVVGADETVFAFVPEKDGCYVFSSYTEEHDPVGRILDSDNNELSSNDDCNVDDYNFRVGAEMKAGETYYLCCNIIFGESTDVYEVELKEVPLATTAELIPVYSDGDTPGGYIGFLINPIPEGSFCPPLEFYVEDESVAKIAGYDSLACGVNLKKVGTTTLYGVSEKHGIHTEVDITCVAPVQIFENDLIWIDEVVQGVHETFMFIPESSDYYVFSADYGAEVHMYDSEFYCIATNSYSDEFSVSYTKAYLEKGETYYLRSVCYDSYEAYSLSLSKCLPAESIELFERDNGPVFVGSEVHFEVSFEPYYAKEETVKWSVSDEAIAELIPDGKFCSVIFKAEGEVTLTAISESGFTASAVIGTDSLESIVLDEKTVVYPADIWGYSLDAEFMFVPEESGTYIFYSEGETDTVGYVVDAEYGDIIAHNDDRFNLNFVTYAYLEAGRAYYMYCESHSTFEESYEVCLTRGTKAKSVSINVNNESFYEGFTEHVRVSFGEAAVCPEEYYVHIDNPDLCRVIYQRDDGFEIEFLQPGTVTVYVETESGLVSDSIVFEVNEAEFRSIYLDEAVDLHFDGTEYYFFEFVPEESGSYTVFSYNNECDPFIRYIDSDLSELDFDDDGGVGVNFSMEINMMAGETYRFAVSKFAQDEPGQYSFMVTETKECESIFIDTEGSSEPFIPLYEIRGYAIGFEPFGSVDKISEVIVEDESVVSLMGCSEDWFELVGVSLGSTTVTVITEGGLSASFVVTVTENEWVEPEIYAGDVNGDGAVNSIDANLLKRYIAGSYSDINEPNADMNSDGRVDAIDANLIVRAVAGQN